MFADIVLFLRLKELQVVEHQQGLNGLMSELVCSLRRCTEVK